MVAPAAAAAVVVAMTPEKSCHSFKLSEKLQK
jgi:hypothetical protein